MRQPVIQQHGHISCLFRSITDELLFGILNALGLMFPCNAAFDLALGGQVVQLGVQQEEDGQRKRLVLEQLRFDSSLC